MSTQGPTAISRLDSFKNILRLERAREFQDTAVMGGLDRFLQRWAREIARSLDRPSLAAELAGTTYSRMKPEERQRWAARWLALLEDEAPAPSVPEHAITPKVAKPPRQVPIPPGLSLDSSVTTLWGVGDRVAPKLRKLGVATVRDLLYLFPRRHIDFSRITPVAELTVGEEQTTVVTVWEAHEKVLGGAGKGTEAVVGDETGNVRVVWFNNPYVARKLRTNARVVLSGRVGLSRGALSFQNPEYEVLARQESLIHTGRLVPIYPLTEGLSSRTVRRITWQALGQWLPRLEDTLAEEMRQRLGLPPLPEAVRQAHYPDDLAAKERACHRLAFDELLLLQLAVLQRRQQWQQGEQGLAIEAHPQVLQGFLGSLPFTLTEAQQRVLGEVLADMERGTPPMARLLQGEVGSGKTVVALAALLATASSGYQGAIMVPTEVLAEQHFQTVSRLLGGLARPVQQDYLFSVYLDPLPQPVSVGLLLGSLSRSAKRDVQQRVSQGSLDILIGTHALIQEEVELPRLALAVVDEQHRFGVVQRAALRQKGTSPHVLVMSATPIPRTLALTLYGDLDIAVIDQLPPGRQGVRTRWAPPEKRWVAYEFVRREVQKGGQAFVICPLIEESEAIQTKAAMEEYDRLSREVFPDLRLGLLHGRMSLKEKEDVMGRFRGGELDLLVSTPVVEVGIDVPNASVMVIEGADRFGLAQLHQFRGRVGRGERQSTCVLLADSPSPEATERLQAMERVQDGFQLAEVDLELRGPGDFFGTRQSGLPSLRMARLTDQELLQTARSEASRMLEEDPELQASQHRLLAQEVSRFLGQVVEEAS
ncbi:MAG: ATP-dependent DNA helicase RecG [Dehalococcoidia bacterium]